MKKPYTKSSPLINLSLLTFLFKGILRDRSRSLFPIIVVALSVAMIVFFKGFMTGIMDGIECVFGSRYKHINPFKTIWEFGNYFFIISF